MLISMNWIRDFVDLSGLNLPELIHRFTLSTAEVEEICIKGEDLREVVAAKILTVENHPDSKKLHLLTVDAGDTVYDVVCGAPNVRPGLVVPFVKEGGQVGDMEIRCAKIAGYESHGMCCSEQELGISAEHSGLMELPDDTVLGTDIRDLYAIRDTVFEVDNKSLTNRPDLWGHYGIAREFAAITGRPLLPLVQADLSAYDSLPAVPIDIRDKEHCLRYTGLKVSGIGVKTSPVDMRIRLFYCGSRAINLLADLTNYLMLEMGQPMHAFDCAKVNRIEVQRFQTPFQFQTLDGEMRNIDENTLMITSGGEPVAVAGIMGGLASEIEADTTSLLLESANFDAVSVRKSSTRLGLRTDASARYEKTLDPEMTPVAIRRFMKLLLDIDSSVQVDSSLTDVSVKSYPEIHLTFDKAYVDRYTGIDISTAQILTTLQSLGFEATEKDESFAVSVPSWRRTKDVTMKADIIEEITRIYGYDNFRIQTTVSPVAPVKRTETNLCDNYAKDILTLKYGLHEVHSYIWGDSKKYKEIGIEAEKNVRLLNAMTPEHDTLRGSIVPTLLSFANENRAYAPEFGLYEIGRVVEGQKENGDCNERKKLGIVLLSKTKTEKELYFSLLEILHVLCTEIKHKAPVLQKTTPNYHWQHPINTAEIQLDGQNLGFLCAIHPLVSGKLDKKAAVVAAQIDMETFAGISRNEIQYTGPSRFPGIDIDLSLLIPGGIVFSDLSHAWKQGDLPLKGVELIDTFEENGIHSITLRYTFSSSEKTLSMEEVQPWVDKILKNLEKIGVTLKS